MFSEYKQFIKESPDFNYMVENGNLERIAANRVLLSIFTEYGLMNDSKMTLFQYSRFIENIQITTGLELIQECRTPIQAKAAKTINLPFCTAGISYPINA